MAGAKACRQRAGGGILDARNDCDIVERRISESQPFNTARRHGNRA
jgi:hypothetical protein